VAKHKPLCAYVSATRLSLQEQPTVLLGALENSNAHHVGSYTFTCRLVSFKTGPWISAQGSALLRTGLPPHRKGPQPVAFSTLEIPETPTESVLIGLARIDKWSIRGKRVRDVCPVGKDVQSKPFRGPGRSFAFIRASEGIS